MQGLRQTQSVSLDTCFYAPPPGGGLLRDTQGENVFWQAYFNHIVTCWDAKQLYLHLGNLASIPRFTVLLLNLLSAVIKGLYSGDA